jgi:hypothetical protein
MIKNKIQINLNQIFYNKYNLILIHKINYKKVGHLKEKCKKNYLCKISIIRNYNKIN